MTVVANPRATGRGRQAAGVEVQRDSELELIAHQREDLVFADRVRHACRDLRRAAILERLDVVDHVANELGYHAARRVQQLGGTGL